MTEIKLLPTAIYASSAINSVVQLLDAAQQNMQSLANVAAGVGHNLNISV